MTPDNPLSDVSQRNPLAPILVQALRHIVELKRAGQSYREIGQAGFEVIAERDRRIAKIERNNAHLRAQLRSLMSGRTIAAERQAIEEEQQPS